MSSKIHVAIIISIAFLNGCSSISSIPAADISSDEYNHINCDDILKHQKVAQNKATRHKQILKEKQSSFRKCLFLSLGIFSPLCWLFKSPVSKSEKLELKRLLGESNAIDQSVLQCSTTKKPCKDTNWFKQGKQDGIKGHSQQLFSQYQKKCSRHKINPNKKKYLKGRIQGLKIFCTYKQGQKYGASGNHYKGVCPEKIKSKFLKGYQRGKKEYKLKMKENELNERENFIETREAELNQRESNIEAKEYNLRDREQQIEEMEEDLETRKRRLERREDDMEYKERHNQNRRD